MSIPEGYSDRVRGLMLGGAIGDALGAPRRTISAAPPPDLRDEESGASYLLWRGRRGAISEVTQLTLFTAEGIIRRYVRESLKGIPASAGVVTHAWNRWLASQRVSSVGKQPDNRDGWLWQLREMHTQRTADRCTIQVLKATEPFASERSRNQHLDSGALMRVSPVVCTHPVNSGLEAAGRVYDFGREVSWTTHGHPDGYVPAAAFATVLYLTLWGAPIRDAIGQASTVLDRDHEADRTKVLLRCLASGESLDADAILRCTWDRPALRALSIALCCARDHADFRWAVTRALAYGFDTAVVGSLTGQLAGAVCGESGLPRPLIDSLELREVITASADDLVGFLKWDWEQLESDETWTRYPGW